MDSFVAVCELWGDDKVLAQDVGASECAVQKWRLRNKIPPGWWEDVVEAARRRGFEDVTLELLAAIAARHRQIA